MTRSQQVVWLLREMREFPGCTKLFVAWRTGASLREPNEHGEMRTFVPELVPDDCPVPDDAVVSIGCSGDADAGDAEAIRDAVNALGGLPWAADAAVRLKKTDASTGAYTYQVECRIR